MASQAAGMPYSGPVDFNKDIDTSRVRGKTVLVTGGASGIGLGLAEALAEAGACVVLGDLDEELGKKEEARLKAKGYNVHFERADVLSYSSQLALFKTTILTHSPNKSLDIVIPSAGIPGDSRQLAQVLHGTPSPPSLDADPAFPAPTAALDLDLTAVYTSVYLALYYFKATATVRSTGPGVNEGATSAPSLSTSSVGDTHSGGTLGAYEKQVLFISSLAGYTSWPARLDYATAKYGVRGLWKSLRSVPSSALGFPFRTNLLAPIFVATPMIGPLAERLRSLDVRVAELSDVVDAGMRCMCDGEVRGRSLCINPGRPGEGGTFDTLDDDAGGEAGPAMQKAKQEVVFGEGFAKLWDLMNRRPQEAQKTQEAVARAGEAQGS